MFLGNELRNKRYFKNAPKQRKDSKKIFMARHNEIGKLGEKMAKSYLVERGYDILETNWTFGKAELDIIAQLDGVMVFVEVKTREFRRFGYPEESVTPKKIQLIYEASSEYMGRLKYEGEIRFDIISIILKPKLEIVQFKDAFFPGWDG